VFSTAGGASGCVLNAEQPGIDALDRGVRPVDVHLDNEFELIICGHSEFASKTLVS